jgi:hypothetical protein
VKSGGFVGPCNKIGEILLISICYKPEGRGFDSR